MSEPLELRKEGLNTAVNDEDEFSRNTWTEDYILKLLSIEEQSPI